MNVLAAPQPLVLVVGSGAAGLAAAIAAAEEGADVVIMTRGTYHHSSWTYGGECSWKTHAFNAAVAPDDSIEAHIQDTLREGEWANDPVLVQTLCHGAVKLIPWLESMGVLFQRDEKGNLSVRSFGTCGTARAVFLEDRHGFHLQQALFREVDRLVNKGKIAIHEGTRALELLVHEADGVVGLRALVVDTGEIITFPSSAVVLADGGGAQMFAPSAASIDEACDGLAIGLRAGAELLDMEYVRFHPIGIVSVVTGFDGFPVEEAPCFDGAVLLNAEGHRFMLDYSPDIGECAPSNEVARGIFAELVAGRGLADHSVIMNIHNCRHLIQTQYPTLYERLVQAGYPPDYFDRVHVRPTSLSLMGGFRIDAQAGTTVPGLYAAGETAGGVHGADLLSGNGLSEALVFGRIAGCSAAHIALYERAPHRDAMNPIHDNSYALPNSSNTCSAEILLERLRHEMYWKAGIIRNFESLREMRKVLIDITAHIHECYPNGDVHTYYRLQKLLDLQNLMQIAHLVVDAAMLRCESRGSHLRTDYPERQPVCATHTVRAVPSGYIWKVIPH